MKNEDIKNFVDEHFDVVPTWLVKKAYCNEANKNSKRRSER